MAAVFFAGFARYVHHHDECQVVPCLLQLGPAWYTRHGRDEDIFHPVAHLETRIASAREYRLVKSFW